MSNRDTLIQIRSDLMAAIRLANEAWKNDDADSAYNLMTDARIKIEEAQERLAPLVASPEDRKLWRRSRP